MSIIELLLQNELKNDCFAQIMYVIYFCRQQMLLIITIVLEHCIIIFAIKSIIIRVQCMCVELKNELKDEW